MARVRCGSSRVDSSVDFDWPGYITETGKDFISVRWSGYLRPAFSEEYTFHVQVNDGARLWVDGVQLLVGARAHVGQLGPEEGKVLGDAPKDLGGRRAAVLPMDEHE